MDIFDFPLVCHWNGDIVEENGDVSYRGGERDFIMGNSKMIFVDLIKEISDCLKVEDVGTLKVKMRYPSSGCFNVLPLNSNRALSALWASVRRSNAPSVNLYIEITQHEPSSQAMITTLNQSSQPPTNNPSLLQSSQIQTPIINQYLPQSSQIQTPIINPSLQQSSQLMSFHRLPYSLAQNETSETNILDEILVDENVEDEEVDEYLNTLGNDDDDDDDVVAMNAPIVEFNKINSLDNVQLNNWITWENFDEHELGEEFAVGQIFQSKAAVTEAVTLYSVRRNQYFKVTESKPHTVTYNCARKQNPCTWKLRATLNERHVRGFKVVTYKGPHLSSCVSDTVPQDHKNLSRTFLSSAIRNLVEVDWSIKISVLIQTIKEKFNYQISYFKAWNAKQRAIEELFGDWAKSYEALPHFMQALQESNPGTVVNWVTTPTANPNVHIFKRIFWAFKPSIDGFVHCRPLITIDGTHLYGKYKGTLLTAMAIDANDQIFPLAFAIVESENTDSWPWFMACIKAFVTRRSRLCVISDRHAGIMKAMSEQHSGWEEPNAWHRYCIRHLSSNVNKNYKSVALKNRFGYTAFQNQKKKFDRSFSRFGELNAHAKQEVSEMGFEKWSMHHDGGYRYGVTNNNMAEVFNNVMKGARSLPITALVKCSFYRVNSYFVERREVAKVRLLQGYPYTSKVTRKMEANSEKATHHKVTKFDRSEGLFQVLTGRGDRPATKGNHTQTINLNNKTCTCSKLQIYKYPCAHVHAVCREMSVSTSQFVDVFYTSEKYLASYTPTFQPIPDEAYWSPYNGFKIMVDESTRRGKGRPKSKRYHNEMDEKTSKVTCSLCGERGHNKKTCARRKSIASPG